jgi:chromosomal replication initiation ATPase DnaA
MTIKSRIICRCGREYTVTEGELKVDSIHTDCFLLSESTVSASNTFDKVKSNFVFKPFIEALQALRPASRDYPKFLLIRGGSQAGKTFSLHAIKNAYQADWATIYLTSRQFQREMIKSLQSNLLKEFEDCFFRADIILIDDLDFLRNKAMSTDFILGIINEMRPDQTIVVTEYTSNSDDENISFERYQRLISKFEVITLPEPVM